MKLICCDPGKNGGFAWTNGDGEVGCARMPATEGDVIDLLRSARANGIERMILEDQTGCVGPNMRVSAPSSFTFGRGFGVILGAAQSMGFQVELVRAQKWQKALSLGTKKDAGGNSAWKWKLKAHAQRLFPSAQVTLETADALLLIEYAKLNRVWNTNNS